jgi:regulator of protease activity HflC (stomatin/prohibitin superfamily)
MKLTDIARSIKRQFSPARQEEPGPVPEAPHHRADETGPVSDRPHAPRFFSVVAIGTVVALGILLLNHPPVRTVRNGDIAIRTNNLTGAVEQFREGSIAAVPGVHAVREFNLRDQLYRPAAVSSASATYQSVEGLTIGVDVSVRYALDPGKLGSVAKNLPDDISTVIVKPAVHGIAYKTFARYTVREIFSGKRDEILKAFQTELTERLGADGLVLRDVQIGKVDLPPDYLQGLEKLLAEELATEKMRYTLELKAKQVDATALDGEAQKVGRQKAAEAAANEQVIAARAQEEAMRHVLPFKQKQIEQRQLEAEAEKVARIRTAEGSAQARRIEAEGEADSRRKLADAEAYRQDNLGKIASAQMARDGALISKHPLLIQKAMAEKLSDKIQVIIAPPSSSGMITAALLGRPAQSTQPQRDGEDGEGSNDKGAE